MNNFTIERKTNLINGVVTEDYFVFKKVPDLYSGLTGTTYIIFQVDEVERIKKLFAELDTCPVNSENGYSK